MGGTTLPGLTLETAKEHTRVSCGWPDAWDACQARPTIEAQGLASPDHHSPAWPHRPIKTDLLLFFLLLPSSVSLSSLPLSLSLTFSLLLPLSLSPNPHKACSHIPLFPLCLSNCCGLKRGMREGNEIERKRQREGESEGKGVIPQNLNDQATCTGPLE